MPRKKPINTTKPSVARLEADGYICQNVEVYLPWCKRKRDFCAFADILAFKAGTPGVLAIQATSRDNVSARVKKCLRTPAVRVWLAAGNRLQVWGWYRVPEGRRKAWRVVVRAITLPQATSEANSEKFSAPQNLAS